jgi:hypothetical protein
MKSNFYKQKGTFLLELVLSMTILSCISLGIAFSITHIARIAAVLTLLQQKSYGTAISLALLQSGIQQIDFHTIPLFPRIHHKKITFADSTSLGPSIKDFDIDSDAITFFEVNPNSTMVVDNLDSSLSCAKLPLTNLEFRSVLAFSLSEITEFEVVSIKQISDLCYAIQLKKPLYSMIKINGIENQKIPTHIVKKIVPLKRIYTLLRSSKGELRYVSHVGHRVIENQPLARRFSQLKLSSNIHSSSEIFELKIEFTDKSAKAKGPYYMNNYIARSTFLNSTLN